jgi:hypothetical protein
MIKKGIPNIIPITKDNSVLKMLAKLTYIKLIITPNKNEISGKTTNVNLIYLLIHRCGRSIISLSKPSILKNITLCQAANANVVGRSPVSICPSRGFCGELRQLVMFFYALAPLFLYSDTFQ